MPEQPTVYDRLYAIVLEVCEQNNALCMDVSDEQKVLAKLVAVRLYDEGVLLP